MELMVQRGMALIDNGFPIRSSNPVGNVVWVSSMPGEEKTVSWRFCSGILIDGIQQP